MTYNIYFISRAVRCLGNLFWFTKYCDSWNRTCNKYGPCQRQTSVHVLDIIRRRDIKAKLR